MSGASSWNFGTLIALLPDRYTSLTSIGLQASFDVRTTGFATPYTILSQIPTAQHGSVNISENVTRKLKFLPRSVNVAFLPPI